MRTMRLHKDWHVRKGAQVFIDIFGISNGGNSTTTVFVFLEGVKRGPR